MNKPTTCGPLYLDALATYATDDKTYKAFAAGFIHGHTEKIHLGAVPAAMFRPSQERCSLVLQIVNDAVKRYGLDGYYLSTSQGAEYWIFKDDWAGRLLQYLSRKQAEIENSWAWHCFRGLLCGIPMDRIDPRFHERKGYGEPCDRVKGLDIKDEADLSFEDLRTEIQRQGQMLKIYQSERDEMAAMVHTQPGDKLVEKIRSALDGGS